MGTPIVPTSGLQEQRTCLYGRVWRFFMGKEATVSRMLRAETSRRYSITLYQRFTEPRRWSFTGHSRLCLVNGTTCRIPSGWTSAPQYFSCKKLCFMICIIRIIRLYSWYNCGFSGVSSFRSWAHLYRYISANQSVNPPSEKSICYTRRWNVSGEIV